MNYTQLKETIIEVLKNDKIVQTNLTMEYRLSATDFRSIYMDFIKEHGGEIKTDLTFFEIKVDTNLTIKLNINE